jgi:hypothetical protein
MKLLCAIMLLSSMLFGQVLYEEHFTGGATQLQWDPWVIYTTMDVVNDPTTPGGDSWIGSVSNDSAPIAAMYAGSYDLNDYIAEAWIFTEVSPAMGSYNGLCVRIDTATGVNAMYHLVSDFDNSARLMLRHITGATPSVIREWTAGEIPGGIPASSSWHKFKIKIVADSIWAYYDDVELPDCPFIDNRVTKGFFGIYFFNALAFSSTNCDDIIVSSPTGIDEYGSEPLSNFSVYPNPFRNEMRVSFSMGHGADGTALTIYDAAGRIVRTIEQGSLVWDGRDDAGKTVAPGVYFFADAYGNGLEKVVKLR